MVSIHGKHLSKALANYYNGPDHPMKMRIWSWLRRHAVTGRLTIPYCAAGWITVDEADLIQREVLTRGTYEPEVWSQLATFAMRDEVVWDVGANVGTVTIQASLDTRVRVVHGFEPDPRTREVLLANIALNLREKCQIHAFALSDREAERTMVSGPAANRGLSTLADGRTGMLHVVRCTTADDLIFDKGVPPPTLMKIDVEGWEQMVLAGSPRLLAECPPKAIVFEALAEDTGDMKELDIVALLARHHYRINHIARPSGIIDERENYLAIHDTA